MINLNSEEFNLNKDFPTPDEILKYVTDYDIFRAYISKVEIGKAINSPLRRDQNPSFSIFYSKRYNKLMFKDFKEGITGDVFSFLKLKFPGLSFNQILQDIVWTFHLEHKFVSNYKIAGRARFSQPTGISMISSQDIKRIRIKSRDWEQHDFWFWKSYGIEKNTLALYNVTPVEYIFIENLSKDTERVIKSDRYSYGYYENKDYISYKIYQPFSKEMKFIGSHNSTVHSGYVQLPGVGEILIITKSLKDVMAIHENSKLPTISVQSESILIKEKIINEYKDRFKKIITLFDNDSTGKSLSKKYKDTYGITGIIIPKHQKFPITDYSDIIKFINRKTAILILNKLLKDAN